VIVDLLFDASIGDFVGHIFEQHDIILFHQGSGIDAGTEQGR
jgi:hypothetical protein